MTDKVSVQHIDFDPGEFSAAECMRKSIGILLRNFWRFA